MQQDLFDKTLASLDEALAAGRAFQDWAEAFAEELSTYFAPAGGALETPIRTQLQTRYMAARVSSLRAQPQKYPLWRFSAILDSRTTDWCRACHDVVLPSDSSWWDGHTPPLHFNCRSTIVGVKQGKRDVRPPRVKVPEGFGNPEQYLDESDGGD